MVQGTKNGFCAGMGKALMAVAAVVAAGGLAGCSNATIRVNGEEGKPLADLDLTGAAPTELVLLGPDEVRIMQGDKLAIAVDGDPAVAARMRFTLKDGALGILRTDKLFQADGGTAVITVTMPAPTELTMAGSGKIHAAVLAPTASVTIAGSGAIETSALSGEVLKLTVAGSGDYRAGGTVKRLDMTIAGSGNAAMGALHTETAKLTIAGSGNAAFASDGTVDATIMGSGTVRVTGRATCKVQAMGSGKLICESDQATAAQSPA